MSRQETEKRMSFKYDTSLEGKGEFREKLFVDKDKLLICLSPVTWRCVEARKSYSQRPTGAHGQFYVISNNHTS